MRILKSFELVLKPSVISIFTVYDDLVSKFGGSTKDSSPDEVIINSLLVVLKLIISPSKSLALIMPAED